jgi:NMD protein affecting ribosome stability and mRNA decay
MPAKRIEVQICSCGRVYQEKRWVEKPLESLAIKHIQKGDSVQIPEDFELPEKGRKELLLHTKKTNQEFSLVLVHDICPNCQRQKTSYFDGILQIRSSRKDVMQHIQERISTALNHRVFISNIEEHKNGVDLYFSDKRKMQRIAHDLHDRFGGTLSEHPTLFSYNHQSSKDLYRLTILLTLPTMIKGDVVDSSGTPVLITKVAGMVQGKNIITGKEIKIPHPEKATLLPIHQTTISQTSGRLEAIHPETYQSEPILNHLTGLRTGQKVRVAIHAKGLILVTS